MAVPAKAELMALFFLPLFHILSLKKQLRGAEGSVAACKFGYLTSLKTWQDSNIVGYNVDTMP